MPHLLELKDVSVSFGKKEVTHGVSLTLDEGEVLGIVGESGSGKSVSMHAVTKLLAQGGRAGGKVLFNTKNGEMIDLLSISDKEMRVHRGTEIGIIFQEPMTSLNPVLTIGNQLSEMLVLHTEMEKEKIKERCLEMLNEVGLVKSEEAGEELLKKYPYQLSGGERQRVMLAIAMILKPRLIIADEPTTALDVTIQDKILTIMEELSKEYGTAIIFISHDLGVIKRIAKRVVVMYKGKVVETDTIENIFERPKQEYTKLLLKAALHADPLKAKDKEKAAKDKDKALKNDKASKNGKASKNDKASKSDKAAKNGNEATDNKADSKGQNKSENEQAVLTVKDVSVFYDKKKEKPIVKNASLTVKRGEILGIVGESGCGKSTLVKAIVGLNKLYDGEISTSCRHPQMVFQDPYASLNPSKKIEWLLMEPMRLHMVHTPKELLAQGIHLKARKYTREEMKKKVNESLEAVGLPLEYADRYPNELSGGERQRVAIAMSLVLGQELIVLDEPVSALDVTVEEKVLKLLVSLKEKYSLSYIFISHDINVVKRLCDNVCVMHNGKIVERGDADEVVDNPKDDYTKKLMSAVPKL